MTGTRLLAPGTNCWRIERADRIAFFIDAAGYFASLRSAIAQARRCVFILGWDFDSRIRLVPAGACDGLPEELGPFLREVVRRQRRLHVYVLSWDFVFLFAGNREWVPLYKLGWRTHPRPRISFRLDSKHPVIGSHHQKVVVVDDAVAFVGGLDLTHGRWDTPAHPAHEPYRVDMYGHQARPNHDVQAIVDGPAAVALGDLCRDRWQRATRQRVEPVARPETYNPWPTGVEPEITHMDVGIARTDPGYVTGQPIEEIRHLYTDAIRHAKRTLYLENQYFSSSVVGSALAERLSAPDAPDVVVVSRLTEEGWLETQTMGVLRARLHRRLQRAAAPDHYRLYYPRVPGLDPSSLLNVHSKVLIMDDELATVGSANFNNRSMGFDTECNIVIEAGGDARVARAIAGLRDRLLAEHLGISPETVSSEIARQEGSLVHAIEARRHEGRSLEPIDPVVDEQIDRLLPATSLVDPERPASAEELAREFVPPEARRPVAGRIVGFTGTLLLLAGFAAALQWTPLSGVVGIGESVRTLREMAHASGATAIVLAIYAAGGLLPLPITVLVIATGIVFGAWPAILYAFVGTLLNAFVSYQCGRWLGRDTIRHFAGSPLNTITARLARKGVWAIASLRVLPVASFWRVNIVAGASRVRQREFMLGTAIGAAPAIVVTVLFIDAFRALIRDPDLLTLAMTVPLAALLMTSAVFASRIDNAEGAPGAGNRQQISDNRQR